MWKCRFVICNIKTKQTEWQSRQNYSHSRGIFIATCRIFWSALSVRYLCFNWWYSGEYLFVAALLSEWMWYSSGIDAPISANQHTTVVCRSCGRVYFCKSLWNCFKSKCNRCWMQSKPHLAIAIFSHNFEVEKGFCILSACNTTAQLGVLVCMAARWSATVQTRHDILNMCISLTLIKPINHLSLDD